MAPSKFVAPLRKDGAGSSFSFSSSSSLSSNEAKASVSASKPAPSASSTTVAAEPNGGSSNSSKCKPIKKPPVKEVSEILKKVCKPPLKKQKVDTTASTYQKVKDKASTSQEGKLKRLPTNDSDKENVNPGSSNKAAKDGPKHAMVSLRDEEYDLIFQAVLARYPPVDSAREINTPVEPEPSAIKVESQDLFSQSDFDDSETEMVEQEAVSGSNPSDSLFILKQTCNDAGVNDNSNKDRISSDVAVKISTSQSHKDDSESGVGDSIPLSPMIKFLCNSQDIDTSGISSTEKGVLCSQDSILADSQPLVQSQTILTTSTPSSTSHQKNLNSVSETFVSPQEVISRPLSQFQDVPLSPATSQMVKTPLSTPIKPPPAFAANLSLEGSKTPLTTHIRPSVPRSLQVPTTPVGTSSSISLTPQPASQKTSTFLPSTPIGSQQISQELQLTPPPPGKTARERLLWLQQKRLAGTWVQCEREACGKWRYLPDCHDPTTLPQVWHCSMHPDEEFNHCSTDENRLSLHAEEDMIFSKYSPGSMVWAKVPGYPWWPAMVEDDPDLEQFYWLNLFSDIPTWYHVVFFDDGDRSSLLRAWVQVERLKHFTEKPGDDEGPETVGFKNRLAAAVKKAKSAALLSIKDRLYQHSFAMCYKGPIGGPSRTKYEGPVGLRKPCQ